MTDIEYLKKYYKGDMKTAIERLNKGEPVQYIIGNVDFYGYNFKVTKDVLIPRFETEQLIEKTIKYAHKIFDDKLDIIDLGTGSGCIAITLSKELDCNVTAIDISDKAIKIARENAIENNVMVDFIVGDMTKTIDEKYDIIISNPPYIRYDEKIMDIVKNNEPHIALYADNDGLYYYEEILKHCYKYLKEKYLIAFEIGKDQGSSIADMVNIYLYNAKVIVEKDLQGLDRFVFIMNGDENCIYDKDERYS